MLFFAKLREGTIIRILVFYSYKLLYIFAIFLFLTIFNSYFEQFVSFSFKFSFWNLLSFVMISNLIDLAKYLVFQGKLYYNPRLRGMLHILREIFKNDSRHRE